MSTSNPGPAVANSANYQSLQADPVSLQPSPSTSAALGAYIVDSGSAAVAAANRQNGITARISQGGPLRVASIGDSLMQRGYTNVSGPSGQTVVVSGGIATMDTNGGHGTYVGARIQVTPPSEIQTTSPRNFGFNSTVLSTPSNTQITFSVNGLFADGSYTVAAKSWTIAQINTPSLYNLQVARNTYLGRDAIYIANYAIGGTTTSDLAGQVAQLLAGYSVHECDISSGTNDIINATAGTVKAAVDTAISNIAAAVSTLQLAGVKARVWIPPGVNSSYGSYATWMTMGAAYMRKKLYDLQAQYPGLELVDMFANSTDANGVLDSTLCAADKIHPISLGCLRNGRIEGFRAPLNGQALSIPYKQASAVDDGSMTGDTRKNIMVNGLLTGSGAVSGTNIVGGSTAPTGWTAPNQEANVSVTLTANQAVTVPSREVSNRATIGKAWLIAATTTAKSYVRLLSSQEFATSMAANQYYRLRITLDATADCAGFLGFYPFLFLTGGVSIYFQRDLEASGVAANAEVKSGDTLHFVSQPLALSSIPASVRLYIDLTLSNAANVAFKLSALSFDAIENPWQ